MQSNIRTTPICIFPLYLSLSSYIYQLMLYKVGPDDDDDRYERCLRWLEVLDRA